MNVCNQVEFVGQDSWCDVWVQVSFLLVLNLLGNIFFFQKMIIKCRSFEWVEFFSMSELLGCHSTLLEKVTFENYKYLNCKFKLVAADRLSQFIAIENF